MDRYFYSEGYVYRGTDTICQLFGTIEEQERVGTFIADLLNLDIGDVASEYYSIWKKSGKSLMEEVKSYKWVGSSDTAIDD